MGAIVFSGGVLLFVALLYAGIAFGYVPYVNAQISSANSQLSTVNASISSAQEQQIIDFYSQITNLHTILAHHTSMTQFLSWLEKNTEANVYYESLGVSGGNQVTLRGIAKSEADINQQVAIFESSSEVANTVVSSISPATQAGTAAAGSLSFNVTLTMQPSVFSPSTTP
jgi:hypothetical protein